MYAPKVGDRLDSLDTPSMIVDLDLMEANIKTLMDKVLPTGVRVRPHLKTTKSAALAHRLVAAGASGGCVAKLSEAEALVAAGFDDLLITCEVVGAPKVRRLVELFRQHPRRERLRIVVDSKEGASAIDAALAEAARTGCLRGGPVGPEGLTDAGDAVSATDHLAVLIDLDVGLRRTGVSPTKALDLAQHVGRLPQLRLIGIQGYEGHLQHMHDRAARREQCHAAMATLTGTAALLREAGFTMDVVTAGGTGTAEFCVEVPGVTEVQPGSFIFMDTDYRRAIGPTYAHSLSLLSTVLSLQGMRRVTIDSGLKTLTTDSGLAECRDGRYRYGVLGDEHGSLEWDEYDKDTCATVTPLRIGDRIEMLPSHIDPTVNLHDVYYAHRNGVIEEIWAVDARGRVQ